MKVTVLPPGVTGDELRRMRKQKKRLSALDRSRKRASIKSSLRKIEERLIRQAEEKLA